MCCFGVVRAIEVAGVGGVFIGTVLVQKANHSAHHGYLLCVQGLVRVLAQHPLQRRSNGERQDSDGRHRDTRHGLLFLCRSLAAAKTSVGPGEGHSSSRREKCQRSSRRSRGPEKHAVVQRANSLFARRQNVRTPAPTGGARTCPLNTAINTPLCLRSL